MLLLTAVRVRALSSAGALCGAGKQRGIPYGQHHRPRQWVVFLLQRQNPKKYPTGSRFMASLPCTWALGALGGLIGTLI